MSEAGFRTDEIISMSITEILLIIIFALVLIAHIFQSQLSDERKHNAELVSAADVVRDFDADVANLSEAFGLNVDPLSDGADITAVLHHASTNLGSIKRRINEIFGVVAEEGRIPETWSELTRLAESVKQMGVNGEGLAKAVLDLNKENTTLEQEISSLRQEQALIEELLEESKFSSLSELIEIIEKLDGPKRQAVEVVKGLEIKNRELAEKVLTMGFGKAPCWIDNKTGKEEYLMNIELGEGQLVAVAAYPDYRNKDLDSLPIDQKMLSRAYSIREFTQAFRPIFEWGKSNEKDCRFFARIKDDRKTSKKGYLASRRAVEDFFFIYDIDFNTR